MKAIDNHFSPCHNITTPVPTKKEAFDLIAYAALIDDAVDLGRFNEIVDKYQKTMFRIAWRIVADHQLAEDAVQNALYGIAVSIKKVPFGNEDATCAYVMSCAKYAALRIKKVEQPVSPVELAEVIDISPDENPTFDAIQQSDDYDRLLHAIEQLDEIYQDVLLHFYVFEQSVKEIAKLFDRKPSTIRQQLSRGRRLLAEICQREGIIHE